METMKNSKLTWIKGQNASWEGVEMTNEKCQRRFGCLELIYSKDDKVIGYVALKLTLASPTDDDGDTDTFIIADSYKEAVILTIEQYVSNEDTYSYADACDEHHGFSEKHTNKVIRAVDDMIADIEHFTWIKEMPETVKVEDMQEFQDALDYHFEHKLGYTESN